MNSIKEIKEKIKKIGYTPRFIIIQVGDEDEQNKLIKPKIEMAKKLGIELVNKKYEINFVEEKIIEDIKDLSPWVDGIEVQLPLPGQYNQDKIVEAIPKNKRVIDLKNNELLTIFTKLLKNIK